MFAWDTSGPLTRQVLDAVIAAVQERLDLLAVLRERYGLQVDDAGERWRTECFLPSLVSDFAGSCAEQDAGEQGGALPRNLWVSEGETTRVWRCHSCKRHGDVIDLIEHADALPRNGQAISLRAVRVAAQLAGVAYLMDGREPDPDDEADETLAVVDRPKRARQEAPRIDFMLARQLNFDAVRRWQTHLHSDEGARAREELVRRGVTPAQVEAYQLGYAPAKWRDLQPAIRPEHRAVAHALGLLGRNRHGNYYDRQRDRIVFPYCEPERDGRPAAVTGFAGRDMSGTDRAPKWLNSENAPGVWEKSSALFGLYQAQARAREAKRVAVTEGAYDTLAFDRADVPAVALVSTALSQAHLRGMVEVLGIEALTIAFDGDEAGRREAFVAATTASTFGLAYEAVTLIDPGDGRDPDDLAPDDLAQQWREPLSILEFAERFGKHARQRDRLALVAVLPDEAASRLRDAWDLSTEDVDRHRDRGASASPTQQLARLLLARPDAATHLARAEVDDVFADEPALARRLQALAFGEQTDERALPPIVRRAWATCRLQQAQAQLSEHMKADAFAAENSHDGFKIWFARGEELRATIACMQKILATGQV